jgi:hypothetical protein
MPIFFLCNIWLIVLSPINEENRTVKFEHFCYAEDLGTSKVFLDVIMDGVLVDSKADLLSDFFIA